MRKQRLDLALVERGLSTSRSQAQNYVKLGCVLVNNKPASKAGVLVGEADNITINIAEQYVSRAGLKLASVAKELNLSFKDKVVLDIGSSTGGFTDYALRHGAKKVIAVDVGSHQLHPSLRTNPKIELHEKTDIRDFQITDSEFPDIILADVSFISLRKILPHVAKNLNKKSVQNGTLTVAMVKPQFETNQQNLHKGVVKNNKIRREIFRQFEQWASQYYVIKTKRDSAVAGEKGNLERFYLLSIRH